MIEEIGRLARAGAPHGLLSVMLKGDNGMRAYIQVSGVVFGVIALLHIVRLFLDWPAQIAGWAVPLWISWIAIFAAGALCIWAFRLVAKARPSP